LNKGDLTTRDRSSYTLITKHGQRTTNQQKQCSSTLALADCRRGPKQREAKLFLYPLNPSVVRPKILL